MRSYASSTKMGLMGVFCFNGNFKGAVVNSFRGEWPILNVPSGAITIEVPFLRTDMSCFTLLALFSGLSLSHHYHGILIYKAEKRDPCHFGLAEYAEMLSPYRLKYDGDIQERNVVEHKYILPVPVVGCFKSIPVKDTQHK